jgi:hypothetical protein
MSLLGAVPGLVLAGLGVMGGISGASSILLTVGYWAAAGLGGAMALLPVLAVSGVFPKGPGKAKPAAAKVVPEKASKKAAVVEPASEEFEVGEAMEGESDEFEAASDDDLEFGEVEEFEEEDDKK